MTFSNSRTLPGQVWSCKKAMASGWMEGASTPTSPPERCMKYFTRSGTSSGRFGAETNPAAVALRDHLIVLKRHRPRHPAGVYSRLSIAPRSVYSCLHDAAAEEFEDGIEHLAT